MQCNFNDTANPTSLACVPLFLSNIINAAAILAGVASIFFIVWAGTRYITSGGDPEKVAKARGTITFAIIGLVIILLSFLIIKIFTQVTGADCSFIGIQC